MYLRRLETSGGQPLDTMNNDGRSGSGSSMSSLVIITGVEAQCPRESLIVHQISCLDKGLWLFFDGVFACLVVLIIHAGGTTNKLNMLRLARKRCASAFIHVLVLGGGGTANETKMLRLTCLHGVLACLVLYIIGVQRTMGSPILVKEGLGLACILAILLGT